MNPKIELYRKVIRLGKGVINAFEELIQIEEQAHLLDSAKTLSNKSCFPDKREHEKNKPDNS